MDEKINAKAIDQYSGVFATKIADSYFQNKERITGPEILALCEISQINFLVVKELMGQWKRETEKWKSPYFDYDDAEVHQAMVTFKNALSNHIAISKIDFVPLLKTAVAQTLSLLLAPYDFYANILDSKGKALLRVDELKNETRYLKINKAPLEKLVGKLEERKSEVIVGNEAFALLDSILEEVNFTPEDVDGYLALFAKVAPLRVDELFDSKIEEPKPVASAPTSPDPASVGIRRKDFKIKDVLTINQKFMFTKILFHGDFEIFSEAIDRFDNLDNIRQAQQYIDNHYPDWDKEGEAFEEFMAILQRKFS